MLRHIVMWKFREDAEGKTAKEHAQWVKNTLETLPAIIPQIKGFEVGINDIPSPASYDAVLISTFESEEDLKTYNTHPEHQKVIAYCKQFAADRKAVDYFF